jgi:hypothetical protein
MSFPQTTPSISQYINNYTNKIAIRAVYASGAPFYEPFPGVRFNFEPCDVNVRDFVTNDDHGKRLDALQQVYQRYQERVRETKAELEELSTRLRNEENSEKEHKQKVDKLRDLISGNTPRDPSVIYVESTRRSVRTRESYLTNPYPSRRPSRINTSTRIDESSTTTSHTSEVGGICPVCHENKILEDVPGNSCGHKICGGCIHSLLYHEISKCPTCRKEYVNIIEIE